MAKQLQTKEEAIQQVQENNAEFYNLALDLARRWVSEQFKPFSSEDFREHCNLILGLPRQPAVFGAVFKVLIKEKRIFTHSYSTAKNKQAHGRITRNYISFEYREKQSKNTQEFADQFRQFYDIGSVCDGCGSKFDAMDIQVGICYCCQKEIK